MKILYAESNLLLTAVFDREQAPEAERLFAAGRAGRPDLRVPAFALAEACRRLNADHVGRRSLADRLRAEGEEFARGRRHRGGLQDSLRRTVIDLSKSTLAEERALARLRDRLPQAATLLPLDSTAASRGREIEASTDLDPSDSLILAAVLCDAASPYCPAGGAEKAFVTTNTKDFFIARVPRPIVKELLDAAGCLKVFADFRAAAGWAGV